MGAPRPDHDCQARQTDRLARPAFTRLPGTLDRPAVDDLLQLDLGRTEQALPWATPPSRAESVWGVLLVRIDEWVRGGRAFYHVPLSIRRAWRSTRLWRLRKC